MQSEYLHGDFWIFVGAAVKLLLMNSLHTVENE